MDLNGKSAVVTGGAMGTGKACAVELAKAGCRVTVADLNEEEGKRTAEEIGGLFVKTDIGSEEDVNHLYETVKEHFGGTDILVNNAAIQTDISFEETTPASFKKVIDTNLYGTFLMISVFSREMKPGSTILNMLSVHYEQPRLNKFAYDASKAGIAMLTKETALALSSKGITVNGISYGAVRTPMNAEWVDDPVKSAGVRKNIPLGWIAEAEEIAAYVKVILESFSEHATGSIFTIDGGRRLK